MLHIQLALPFWHKRCTAKSCGSITRANVKWELGATPTYSVVILTFYLFRESPGQIWPFPVMHYVTFTHSHMEAAQCNQSFLLSTALQQSHAKHLAQRQHKLLKEGTGIASFSAGPEAWTGNLSTLSCKTPVWSYIHPLSSMTFQDVVLPKCKQVGPKIIGIQQGPASITFHQVSPHLSDHAALNVTKAAKLLFLPHEPTLKPAWFDSRWAEDRDCLKSG